MSSAMNVREPTLVIVEPPLCSTSPCFGPPQSQIIHCFELWKLPADLLRNLLDEIRSALFNVFGFCYGLVILEAADCNTMGQSKLFTSHNSTLFAEPLKGNEQVVLFIYFFTEFNHFLLSYV